MMLLEALQFLVRTGLDLLGCAFFLRFWMQWTRVPYHNPFARFVGKVTDFAVRPLRRAIPGFLGVDWSSLLSLLLTELLCVLAVSWLMGYPFGAAGIQVLPGFLLLGLAATLRLVLYVLMGLVILQAVLSWVNPFSPHAPVFYALARPVLAPFQKIIPPVGGVDISPIAALVVIQLCLIVPVTGLERLAHGLVW
ncbi:MAG TPA: YggT family protein [Thiobacillaceae bacterium]|nr:YggT family protein [Thiobacillaceae bacterium]HNU65347.1 YggT family protein [Thiobacillaceae bacterium]